MTLPLPVTTFGMGLVPATCDGAFGTLPLLLPRDFAFVAISYLCDRKILPHRNARLHVIPKSHRKFPRNLGHQLCRTFPKSFTHQQIERKIILIKKETVKVAQQIDL